MTVRIATNNEIVIDGSYTGYGVYQAEEGTIVYKFRGPVLKMPRNRYSLSGSKPLSGNPGLDQFEVDFRKLIGC